MSDTTLPCLVCGEDVEDVGTECVPLVSPNADEDGTVLIVVICSRCFDTLTERAMRVPYQQMCELALSHTVSMS